MRRTIILAALAMIPITATPNEISRADEFLAALAAVESGGDDAAVNEREDAHGRYQIRAAYLADANEYAGTSYTLADCHDPAIARAVVTAYLTRYGNAPARTGRLVTARDLARIHNGGPRGWQKAATLGYADRFEAALEGGVR